MIFNKIAVIDFETCSRSPYNTQPLQICACIVDIRRLEISKTDIFQSYIKPIPDDVCEDFGLNKVEKEALEVNKIKPAQLENAPSLKVVWAQFESFVNQHNPKKTKWDAPILAGYNNNRFDDIIIDRICGGNKLYNPTKKEPYKFGPWDDDDRKNKLFHPRDNIDVMKLLWYWFENEKSVKSFSLDNMRELFGINKDKAHNAIKDVLDTAFLLIKFLRFERYIYDQMGHKFKNSFDKENKIIEEMMKCL